MLQKGFTNVNWKVSKPMYCGIKIAIKDDLTKSRLLRNPELAFTALHKESGEVVTGEDKIKNHRFNYSYAEYKKFTFKIYDSGLVIIKGSLHYYFNDSIHNYNQFTLTDLVTVLKNLFIELDINPNKARLQNLEFGVNLLTPFDPDCFINNVISHKGNHFNIMDIKDGYGKTSLHDGQFGVKIYNKGLQFHLDYWDLRVEVKCKKMEKIRKGAIYLADLLTPGIINKCKELILKTFEELIIKEPVELNQLSNKDKEFYLKYINPDYHTNEQNKVIRCREKKRYNELLVKYSTDNVKEKTFKILVETLSKITNPYPQTCNLLTAIEKPILQPFDYLDKLSIGCTELAGNKQPIKCITCGRDISNQKVGSLYCSEKLFGREAKKCRNKNSNPRNNIKRKIIAIKSNGILFDIEPFLKCPSFNNS